MTVEEFINESKRNREAMGGVEAGGKRISDYVRSIERVLHEEENQVKEEGIQGSNGRNASTKQSGSNGGVGMNHDVNFMLDVEGYLNPDDKIVELCEDEGLDSESLFQSMKQILLRKTHADIDEGAERYTMRVSVVIKKC